MTVLIPEEVAASSAPQQEYTRRLAERQAEVERYTQRHKSLGNWRLAVVAAGLLIALLAFGYHLFSGWWLVLPLVLSLALAHRHDRVIRGKERVERAAAFYKLGLWRLEDRWQGHGVTGARFADPKHPYSGDLDLFGRGSLYELLCAARTRMGEERLAAWLRTPADPRTVRARQQAVAELRPQLDLREDLTVLGEQARMVIKVDELAEWGAAPPVFTSPRTRDLTILLVVAILIGAAIWGAGISSIPFFVALVLQRGFAYSLRARVRATVRSVDRLSRELEVLAALLTRLEHAPCETPLLRELHAAFATDGPPPSASIARLQRLIELLEVPHNPALMPLCALLLWTQQVACAIDAWRAVNGARIARWLDAVGGFEALCSLAGYAYEHPDDPFPQILEEGRCFEAKGMTHPLLPAASAIRNDLSLSDEQRLYIVSGSNMSGKSTLLRTVGINAVLAFAGAPVRAQRLRLSPLNLGASIRNQDSLQEGISRFYAEILRLHQIVDLASGEPPLLFLLDEILNGTNSHDRRVGAEAVLRTLIERGAIGLVTTHDLVLAQIANDPALHALNIHFEDQLTNGKMTFDYHLRPGVVQKSNAIELMRAVGLDV